ncbi:hypothetical protein J7L84_00880 [Candidatus Bipolaricaulota bacterium]|nr:hypothetical protein [Candidatus Bipolaricaulota bacterium]
MRKLLAVLFVLLAASCVLGQVNVVISRGSSDAVLQEIRNSTLPLSVKNAWLQSLPRAFAKGLVSPAVALGFFRNLEGAPEALAVEITDIMVPLLGLDLPLDYLMNTLSRDIRMGLPWDMVRNDIELRAGLILAAHGVLSAHRPHSIATSSFSINIGGMEIHGHTPTWEDVEVEVAGALADFIAKGGSPNDTQGMYNAVVERLRRLRASGFAVQYIDHLLQALSPDMVGQIIKRTFSSERG